MPASPSKNYLTRIDLAINGEPAGEYYFEAGRVMIGRAPDSEIHVNSKFVSRHHAQLVSGPEGCFVEDLNSTNGIQLNGNPVQKQLLDDGDVIAIDDNQFTYHDLREADDVEAGGKGTKTG